MVPYPPWADICEDYFQHTSNKKSLSAQQQEGARRDVERAFESNKKSLSAQQQEGARRDVERAFEMLQDC
jgi:hypothetical protein